MSPQTPPLRSGVPSYPRTSSIFDLIIQNRFLLLNSINLNSIIMIVQLVVITNKLVGVSENGTDLYKKVYRRSAAMTLADCYNKYGEWMSTNYNWHIKPVRIEHDFDAID